MRSIILKQVHPEEEEDEFKLNVGPYSRVSIFSDIYLMDWTILAVPARDPRQLCILDSSRDTDEDFLQSPIYWKYFRRDLERAPPTKAGASGAGAAAISVRFGLFDTRDKAQAALAARPGGAARRIEVVELNGRIFYRAIVTFRDRAAAQAYCAGGRACLIR